MMQVDPRQPWYGYPYYGYGTYMANPSPYVPPWLVAGPTTSQPMPSSSDPYFQPHPSNGFHSAGQMFNNVPRPVEGHNGFSSSPWYHPNASQPHGTKFRSHHQKETQGKKMPWVQDEDTSSEASSNEPTTARRTGARRRDFLRDEFENPPVKTSQDPFSKSKPHQNRVDLSESNGEEKLEFIALNPFLTEKWVDWDIRNMLSTARDHSPSKNRGNEVPFDNSSGLPSRIKVASISFVNREIHWIQKRWGAVVVENKLGEIMVGDIFAAISEYFGKRLREQELEDLVRSSPEQGKQVGAAWDERVTQDSHKRENNDHGARRACRRSDLMRGLLKFRSVKMMWTGKESCHLALTLC